VEREKGCVVPGCGNGFGCDVRRCVGRRFLTVAVLVRSPKEAGAVVARSEAPSPISDGRGTG